MTDQPKDMAGAEHTPKLAAAVSEATTSIAAVAAPKPRTRRQRQTAVADTAPSKAAPVVEVVDGRVRLVAANDGVQVTCNTSL